MGLELLTQADYVLNNCGRPVAPKGYRFVDLPRIIAFHQTPQATPGTQTPQIIDNGDIGSISFTGVAGTKVQVINQAGTPNLPFFISVVGNVVTLGASTTAAGFSIMLASLAPALIASNPAAAALITALDPNADFPIMGSVTIPPSVSVFNQGWPTQNRIENTGNTLFIVKGIMLQTDPVQVRLKWPTGRYWNQFPSPNPYAGGSAAFPQGTGGNLYALDEEQHIERGGKVAIELSGPNAAPVDIQLWGALRYLLKESGGGAGAVDGKTCIVGYPANSNPEGPPACLIGYPVTGPNGAGPVKMIPDPVQVLKYRRRFNCWPNGNIMAPEFRLGNQCETDTPSGFNDESFTFFSNPIVVPSAGQNYSNLLPVPGQEDVVIRRFRASSIVWAGGAVGNPVVQIRLPNGYSMTGGDQIPLNLGYWFPVFPTLRVAAGTGLILDISDSDVADTGTSITVTLEFDAVKRRRNA